MFRQRVIPVLLLEDGGLVKTVKFSNPDYIGDPINAVRIFNEKEVDELMLFDIAASRENLEPDYDLIHDIASEAFMPIGYGGGVKTAQQASRLVTAGIEKICLNSGALDSLDLVQETARVLGSSSTVASINVKKDWRGRYKVFDSRKKRVLKRDLMAYIEELSSAGAGELFINNVDLDGTAKGYDLNLVRSVCRKVELPVIVCGGAGSLSDFKDAANAHASGVSAGSLFVYMGKHKAVMINYPDQAELKEIFRDE